MRCLCCCRLQAAERDLAKRMAVRGTPDQVVSQVLTDVVVVDDSTSNNNDVAVADRSPPVRKLHALAMIDRLC